MRRRLLDDPAPAAPPRHRRGRGAGRTVKAQLARERLRADAADEAAFRASLDVMCEMFAPRADDLPRIVELFERTTQFNATGARFSVAELQAAVGAGDAGEGPLRRPWPGRRGGGRDGEILGFALSCRVIGLGVEQRLLAALVAAQGRSGHASWRRRATRRRAGSIATAASRSGRTGYGASPRRRRPKPPARRASTNRRSAPACPRPRSPPPPRCGLPLVLAALRQRAQRKRPRMRRPARTGATKRTLSNP